MRAPGRACRRRASTRASWSRTPGELTVFPAGNVTTGTNAAFSPPVPPYRSVIARLVFQPSLPGTEKRCFSALVAGPAAAIPATVRTSQKTTTVRLCERTQRVSEDMGGGLQWGRWRGEQFVAQMVRLP